MSSVNQILKPELKSSQSESDLCEDIIQKQKSRNGMTLANYHSRAANYSVENYNDLLKRWNDLNPNEKEDGDFANKNPSKSLFAKLVGKVNKAERRKNKQQDNPPLEQDNPPLDLVKATLPEKIKK